MSRYRMPVKQGTEAFPTVIKRPVAVRFEGVPRGSREARALLNAMQGAISRFYDRASSAHAAGVISSTTMYERSDYYQMQYQNVMGDEAIFVKVTPTLVERIIKEEREKVVKKFRRYGVLDVIVTAGAWQTALYNIDLEGDSTQSVRSEGFAGLFFVGATADLGDAGVVFTGNVYTPMETHLDVEAPLRGAWQATNPFFASYTVAEYPVEFSDHYIAASFMLDTTAPLTVSLSAGSLNAKRIDQDPDADHIYNPDMQYYIRVREFENVAPEGMDQLVNAVGYTEIIFNEIPIFSGPINGWYGSGQPNAPTLASSSIDINVNPLITDVMGEVIYQSTLASVTVAVPTTGEGYEEITWVDGAGALTEIGPVIRYTPGGGEFSTKGSVDEVG